MAKLKSPLESHARETTARLLQEILADLIDLAVQTKQAHWNLRGPNFRPLHLQLDKMEEAYRSFSDEVAERRVAIGEPADGRVRTVGAQTKLEALPSGWIDDERVVTLFVERLRGMSARMRECIAEAGDVDPVTEDLFIGITNKIQEQAWMIQAQSTNDQSA